ncbi:hypothetical protein EC988_001784 [Linderina pennispora]|nr:hypothetical protein EC988_001784 [Linderina pennispora]
MAPAYTQPHSQYQMAIGNGHHQHITNSTSSGGQPLAQAGYEWSRGYSATTGQAHIQDISGMSARTGMQAAATKSGAQSLRSKVTERLQQIDREVFESEARAYEQKSEEIQSELAQILRGAHPVFIEGVARLSAERDRMLTAAEQNHRYLVDLYERTFQHDRDVTEKAYRAEKQAIYDKIAADIEDRRRRLKEEKDSLDISMDFVFDPSARTSSKRNLRKRGNDTLGLGEPTGRHPGKRKNNQVFGVQGIPEDDIISDLVAIRRATGVTGPLGNGNSGKKGHKGHKR